MKFDEKALIHSISYYEGKIKFMRKIFVMKKRWGGVILSVQIVAVVCCPKGKKAT